MDKTQILSYIITAVSIIFVLVTHEWAHGYVAYLNGDTTAKDRGRLTLNPLKHLDLLGTISMIVFRFGWAKPVPINQFNFKKQRFGLFTVAIAGIIINLLTAFICLLIMYNIQLNEIVFVLLDHISFYGIVFAVFNLIPIPPLDGSKILASILPQKFQYFIYKYEKYSMLILVIFIASGLIDKIFSPMILFVYKIFTNIIV